MNVIQIRGTSGSGKSTAMKSVMERMGDWNSVTVPKRKKPLYYRSCSDWPDTVVLGHYESPCGGGDTIGSAGQIFNEIQALDKLGVANVLCEGLLLSEDTKWSLQLSNLRVVFLKTPVQQCLAQIKQRRESVGNEKELNPANTVNRVPVIERARAKLEAVGVYCRPASMQQAPTLVLSWLRELNRGH